MSESCPRSAPGVYPSSYLTVADSVVLPGGAPGGHFGYPSAAVGLTHS